MRRASAALVLVLGAVAVAGDPSATVDLRTPTWWTTGEVVTASVTESTRTSLSSDRPLPVSDIETKLEAKFVQRCVEADPNGKLLRSLVRVDSWSMKGATRDDRCLEGALVEVSPAGWTLVAATTNPSRSARGWLNTRFGADARGFSGGFAELAAPGPLAAGATWAADPPAIAKGLVEGGLPVRPEPRKWKFALAETGTSPAGATAKVTFDETIPLSGDAGAGGRTIHVAEGSSVRAHGEYAGVPGSWQRTGRMDTVTEQDLDTSAAGTSVKIHIVTEETESWNAGGAAPEAPKSAAAVAVGVDEKWVVGDTMAESGEERRTVVATPVLDDDKDGTPEKTETSTTWSAEIECVEAYSDHWPKALTVVLREWTSTQGTAIDRSLNGAVVRVTRDGFKIASGGDDASASAKEWLNARYGRGVQRDDALRAAVTPVMRVAPKQSWASDPVDTENALRGRFEYPIEAESVHGKGTLAAIRSDGVGVSYEVEAAISCVPGCMGSGADLLKGTIRAKGEAAGPPAQWTLLGSFQEGTNVSVTVPGQKPGEQSRRLVITEGRRVARSPLKDRSAASWAQSAGAKVDRRDYDGAIADAAKAIDGDAKCVDAWFNRARAKAGKRDAAGAVADYTKALEIDPKSAAAYNNRGLQKRALGDADGAIADYTKAIEVSPRYSLALRNRGVAKAGKGDHEGAIADFDKAIEIRPKYVEAYNDRGLAHYNRREYADAADDYGKAAELAPKEALYVVNRANAKSAMGDLDGALADHDAAIALDPSNARAYYFRANVRGRKSDAAGARADLDKAIELDPKFASNWNDRGNLRDRQGDVDGALADWTKAIELDPRHATAHFNVARAQFAPGAPLPPVVEALRKSFEGNDDTDYERLWLCLARTWSGEAEAAKKELADFAAARKSSGPDEWYPVLVGLLTGTRTEDAAIAAAKTIDAKTSRERLCEATFYSAMLRAIRGDAAKAVELLDRCIATDVRNFTEFDEAVRWRRSLLLGAATGAVDGGAARRVVSPDPRGPLARAGLRDGDRITGIDGKPLTPGRLDEALAKAAPGTSLALDVAGKDGARRVVVVLGEWRSRARDDGAR